MTGIVDVVGIAVGLAMDAFAVSVATSVALQRIGGRRVFRFAFHFGLFQAVMPILGWLAGSAVAGWIAAWSHWLAFALLLFVGVKAIVEAWRGDLRRAEKDPTRGLSLVVLSVATSVDAFAVGLSIAWLEGGIWLACLIIGLITAALTTVGMYIGRHLGLRFGRGAAIAGGGVLIGIGIKIVLSAP